MDPPYEIGCRLNRRSIFRFASIFLVEACPYSPQKFWPIADRGEFRALLGANENFLGKRSVTRPASSILDVRRTLPKNFSPTPKSTQDLPRSATGQHPRGERENVSTRKTPAKRKIEGPSSRIRADHRSTDHEGIEPGNRSDRDLAQSDRTHRSNQGSRGPRVMGFLIDQGFHAISLFLSILPSFSTGCRAWPSCLAGLRAGRWLLPPFRR